MVISIHWHKSVAGRSLTTEVLNSKEKLCKVLSFYSSQSLQSGQNDLRLLVSLAKAVISPSWRKSWAPNGYNSFCKYNVWHTTDDFQEHENIRQQETTETTDRRNIHRGPNTAVLRLWPLFKQIKGKKMQQFTSTANKNETNKNSRTKKSCKNQ